MFLNCFFIFSKSEPHVSYMHVSYKKNKRVFNLRQEFSLARIAVISHIFYSDIYDFKKYYHISDITTLLLEV